MDTTLTLIILLALVALACFALASGLLLGLVYVEYLCRPTVYRFNWPSDPTEDIKDVEDDSFVAVRGYLGNAL
ncbi:hypothetical protein OE88DRAFT_1665386 [Heliocybe sulcata]|uniref:Uncharacterized protein n=1 Tax=Heliocybe sulcata TaxID=5364 RepID=A0A5C3MSN0_9AGAM|nr:hypothetical protein OE88DRAFT_1665386 [Heliocybe sulcata]